MPRITNDEYRTRLEPPSGRGGKAELELFLVTSFDSIYYLTGAGFEPLERPFFLAVYPGGVRRPTLLVPRLDAEHMKKARNVAEIRSGPIGSIPPPTAGDGSMGCGPMIGTCPPGRDRAVAPTGHRRRATRPVGRRRPTCGGAPPGQVPG